MYCFLPAILLIVLQHILQASQGLNLKELYVRSLLAGFCFHSYQQVRLIDPNHTDYRLTLIHTHSCDPFSNDLQVSYYILGLVSPVTHSVGNCLKRVVVIVSSVIFFRIPVSPLNSLGNLPTPIQLVSIHRRKTDMKEGLLLLQEPQLRSSECSYTPQ